MKKERLFYLDFVRAIAAISIVLTHYNAVFLYAGTPEKAVITLNVSNIYIGSWGVSLFFIISGAALMYVYQEKCELKSFYKKRFFSLYPMFWIAYAIAFLYLFYVNKGVNNGAPKINMLLTIIGFDGYLAENVQTFYILGEWFLGCIILIYLIFPLLRKLVNEHPKITAAGVIIIYAAFILFYNLPFNQAKVVLVRLPEVMMGMYFVKYIKKVKWPAALISAVVLVANGLLKPSWTESFQTTYVGIASFLLIVYLSYFLKFKITEKISDIISKYSYAIFLVHHVVIMRMMGTFNLGEVSIIDSYILFLACCFVIGLLSYLLFIFHKSVMKQVNECFIK